MSILILGSLLWSGIHMLPILQLPVRARAIERLGAMPYQGVFALGILGSLALIILGWRGTVPSLVYAPPAWGRPAAMVLMYLALVLFIASGVPTNIKRVCRHPQLTGLVVWAAAHLLANGESRSLVLFGGLALWAIVAMVMSNRRDGDWVKPEKRSWTADLKPVLVAAVVYAVLLFAHPYFAGVSLVPGQ